MIKNYILFWIGLLIIFFGSVFASVGWYSIQLENRFKSEGKITTAQIKSKNIEERWETDSDTKKRTKKISYYINYQFKSDQGLNFESRDSVSSDLFHKAEANSPIEIQYIESNPSKNRIASNSDYVFGYVFTGLGTIIVIVGITLIYYDRHKKHTANKIIQEGLQTEGIIDFVGPGNLSINKVQQWKMRYNFKDYKGQSIQGQTPHFSPEIAQELKAGQKIKIKYIKENPKQNIWIR